MLIGSLEHKIVWADNQKCLSLWYYTEHKWRNWLNLMFGNDETVLIKCKIEDYLNVMPFIR